MHEVQVQDAVKADADQTMERLKEDLKKQNITWASMDRNEPADYPGRRQGRDHRQGCSRHPDRAPSAAWSNERYPTYVLTRRSTPPTTRCG